MASDRQIVVIAHNLRSAHNVGSLLRTAEGLGVHKVYLTGYTPYPLSRHDKRLPHIANKVSQQINKTALDADRHLAWTQSDDVTKVVERLKNNGFVIVALEQTAGSVDLRSFRAGLRVALLLGNEPLGVDAETLKLCDIAVEIPMRGHKESFNVVQAAAIALYQLTYF